MKIVLTFILLFSELLGTRLELSGFVNAENQKVISSRYMGFVTHLGVIEGQRVKKGDLLYKVDSSEIDNSKRQVELMIQQSELSLQMYQNQLIDVRLNLARNRRLYKKDVISKYQLEQLELASKKLEDMVNIAKKQLLQAKLKLKDVEHQYEYLKIKAPNDGVIIQKNINEGEIALPGVPAMVLTDMTNLKVVAQVSEQNLIKFKRGKKVFLEIPSLKKTIIGKVFAIIPSSNPMTHTFKVKFSFPMDKDIYPGMYVKIITSD